jgi:sarcosine oxidase, subunit gamma
MADATGPTSGRISGATVGGARGWMAFARSPLAGRAEDLAAIGASEVAFLGQVNLRLDPALGNRVPLALPPVPNTWAGPTSVPAGGRYAAGTRAGAAGTCEALWLGPDEWLIVAEPGSAPAIIAALEHALDGLHRSVVDVSANRAVIELAGDGRLDLLSHGCALDLHPRSWRAGMCAQTLLAQVPVLLQERDHATRIFVRLSLAAHLVDWLPRMGQPVGPPLA